MLDSSGHVGFFWACWILLERGVSLSGRRIVVAFRPQGGHHTITGAKRPPPGFTDPEKMHPFATLVTSDAHDQASDLKWPSNPRAHDP